LPVRASLPVAPVAGVLQRVEEAAGRAGDRIEGDVKMKIYLGIVGSKKVHAFAQDHHCGWVLTPDNHRNVPSGSYFLDNGAFSAWKNNKPYKIEPFLKLIEKYPDFDFLVVPDIVCGGMDSFRYSQSVVHNLPQPRYLAVQDGMRINDIFFNLENYDGIFVGGSIDWKYRTAIHWADVAHHQGLKCHVGRVGTWEGLTIMDRWGIDSVDTTTPSRHQCDAHIVKYQDQIQHQMVIV